MWGRSAARLDSDRAAISTRRAMKARPTLFLSGVSHEFGSFRDAVENEINP